MNLPTNQDQFPCSALYHEDEHTGDLHLMFERPLNSFERNKTVTTLAPVVGRPMIWTDTQTLRVLAGLETD